MLIKQTRMHFTQNVISSSKHTWQYNIILGCVCTSALIIVIITDSICTLFILRNSCMRAFNMLLSRSYTSWAKNALSRSAVYNKVIIRHVPLHKEQYFCQFYLYMCKLWHVGFHHMATGQNFIPTHLRIEIAFSTSVLTQLIINAAS